MNELANQVCYNQLITSYYSLLRKLLAPTLMLRPQNIEFKSNGCHHSSYVHLVDTVYDEKTVLIVLSCYSFWLQLLHLCESLQVKYRCELFGDLFKHDDNT